MVGPRLCVYVSNINASGKHAMAAQEAHKGQQCLMAKQEPMAVRQACLMDLHAEHIPAPDA